MIFVSLFSSSFRDHTLVTYNRYLRARLMQSSSRVLFHGRRINHLFHSRRIIAAENEKLKRRIWRGVATGARRARDISICIVIVPLIN